MKRRLAMLGLLALIALNSAAAAAPTPPQPAPDQALVCIYRLPTAILMLRAATFAVDGAAVARLMPKQYSCFLTPPGDHVLGQKWPLDVSFGMLTKTSVHWDAGQSYHYRFQPDGNVGMTNGVVTFDDTSSVWPASEDEVATLPQTFKFVPARTAK